jgi:2-keto-myo-inositol isomerase
VPAQVQFALNQMTAPRLGCRAFLDLAAVLGCVGVELRNDLADKRLSTRPFFDGEKPARIGDYARSKGLRLLGLSEAYGFNSWSDSMCAKVQLLADKAEEAGAESISLIPLNCPSQDGRRLGDDDLRRSLGEILPILERARLVALVEPLGFVSSTLRHKADAVAAIEAVGGKKHYKLVHDTFHHYLARESDFFPEYTGIVHISGVVDSTLGREQMQDGHRILVDDEDRLGNVEQIRVLLGQGYGGAFSYEPFSSEIHQLARPDEALGESMRYIRANL